MKKRETVRQRAMIVIQLNGRKRERGSQVKSDEYKKEKENCKETHNYIKERKNQKDRQD